MHQFGDVNFKIREATDQERENWNKFVDNEDGGFFYYYDWKSIYETRGDRFVPLIMENASSGIMGIFPIVKQKRTVYSILFSLPEGASGGFLLKKDLSIEEKDTAISAFLKYIGAHYSKNCIYFRLKETLAPSDAFNEEPTKALVDNGFDFKYDKTTKLPCTHIIQLKQPFIANDWKKIFSRNLRTEMNRAEKNGVVIFEDKELNYTNDFFRLFSATLQRHGPSVPIQDEINTRFRIFKDKQKLFVAILNGKPIVALLCYYSLSTCYLAKVGSYTKDIQDANKLCYKFAIEDACNKGYRFVEFGISNTSNLAFFKERFGAKRVPLRTWVKTYSSKMAFIERVATLIFEALGKVKSVFK
jgi:hypothetical protein